MKDKPTVNAADTYKRLAFGEPFTEETVVISEAIKRLFINPKQIKGYQRMAAVWLGVVAFAIIAAIIAVGWVFQSTVPSVSEDNEYSSYSAQRNAETSNVILLVVKAVLLLVPLLFLLRFANRSYRINKHLEVTFAHRWALQKSLAEYIEVAGPNANREQIVMEVLPFFYNDIETGYITKKDGLGDKTIEIMPPALAKSLGRR